MSIIETRVGGRYKLKNKIGNGSFGDIYLAQNVQTQEDVAVKLEESRTKYPQLIYEAKILHSLQGTSGIPILYWCGQEGDYNVLVMERLGENLEELLEVCSRQFTMKTVLLIADQLLQTIEYIHNKGFLHRDIKPENLLVGTENSYHVLHFIDFGLSKRYRDPKTGKHIPYRDGKQLTGTARYCSIATHKGLEQARRDDLEALGYVFVYFFKGSLPWQGMKALTKQEKYNAIMEKKINTPLSELCKGMPEQFVKYLEYCRKLRFEEKPDYVYLRRMFKELFLKEGYESDYVFDWLLIPLSRRYDFNFGNVQVNVEFNPGDSFINNNLPPMNQGIEDYDFENGDEGETTPENHHKIGFETHKAEGKGIGTEHLRTEFKSIENKMSKKPGAGSPEVNKAILTRNPLYMKTQQSTEKKKDCTIF